MAQAQFFRANVGMVVVNDDWQVLALERIDKDALRNGEKRGTGQWQMPQGGLDKGEEPEDAWKRELTEETQITSHDVDLLGVYPEWLAYELPKEVRAKPEVRSKQGRGQVQKWFFVKLKRGAKINLEPTDPMNQEFVTYEWLPLEELAEKTWEVRRLTYRKLAEHLNQIRRTRGEKHT
jgi:putative (di)nucleoside polyphosphate hydrolase